MCMGGPGMDAVLAHHAQLNAYERTGDPSYLTAAQQIPGAVVTGTSTEETECRGPEWDGPIPLRGLSTSSPRPAVSAQPVLLREAPFWVQPARKDHVLSERDQPRGTAAAKCASLGVGRNRCDGGAERRHHGNADDRAGDQAGSRRDTEFWRSPQRLRWRT